jgi:hypothetical protein
MPVKQCEFCETTWPVTMWQDAGACPNCGVTPGLGYTEEMELPIVGNSGE